MQRKRGKRVKGPKDGGRWTKVEGDRHEGSRHVCFCPISPLFILGCIFSFLFVLLSPSFLLSLFGLLSQVPRGQRAEDGQGSQGSTENGAISTGWLGTGFVVALQGYEQDGGTTHNRGGEGWRGREQKKQDQIGTTVE